MYYSNNIVLFLTDLIDDIFFQLSLSKRERKIYNKVPKTCFYCHLRDDCRDENNKWKCRKGCMILNYNRKLPYRCENCLYLYKCRDENNEWKCRNGCIIINKRKAKEQKRKNRSTK